MTGDVRVMVTTTFGSVAVEIFMAASSGTTLRSYFSSVTFCHKNKIATDYFSPLKQKLFRILIVYHWKPILTARCAGRRSATLFRSIFVGLSTRKKENNLQLANWSWYVIKGFQSNYSRSRYNIHERQLFKRRIQNNFLTVTKHNQINIKAFMK